MGLGVASNLSLCLLVIGIQSLVVCSMMMNHNHGQSSTVKASVFLKLNELKKGTTKPFYLPKHDISMAHFLPREEADPIPFSSEELPDILSRFSAPPGSALAQTIESTLLTCEARPVEGETKFCATSVESMLDFVLRIFGISENSDDVDSPILLTPTFRSGHRETYQNYTIVEKPREVSASKVVSCHTQPYPYGVMFCHYQHDVWNKVYKALLQGQNGDFVDVYVMCHLNTSEWDPAHRSFAELGTHPGTPACHVFPPHGNFLWVHNDPPTPNI